MQETCITKYKNQYFEFSNCIERLVFYKDYYIDEDGHKHSYELFEELKKLKIFHRDKYIVIQFNYELGFLFEDLEHLISDEVRLFTLYHFDSFKEVDISKISPRSQFHFDYSIDENSYKKSFEKVMDHLLNGDAYQINLTHLFKMNISSITALKENFLSQREEFKHGHFYHYLYDRDFELLSNSPECLFELEGDSLVTRPIKGTVKQSEGLHKLQNSEKDISELNIITDLLRNDLSRIGESYSNVSKMRDYFTVPGLFQQYSEIKVRLDPEVDLYQILRATYPGGSITGAPKRRVLSLINDIETTSRNFYTGSTIFITPQFVRGSINIRTAKIEDNEVYYGAGGGITLLSDANDEYHELISKIQSFFTSLSK